MTKKNKNNKSRLVLIAGTFSSALGALGAIVVGLGLCPCVIAPFLSFTGLLIFFYGAMKSLSIPLLVLGAVFIALGIYWRRNKTCKVHR